MKECSAAPIVLSLMKIASHDASVTEKGENMPARSSSKPICTGMAMTVAITRMAMKTSHLVLKVERGSITHACMVAWHIVKSASTGDQIRDQTGCGIAVLFTCRYTSRRSVAADISLGMP